MALNFRKFLDGIRIIPKTTSTVSEKGDLEVDNATGKLIYHDGSSPSAVVTETQGASQLIVSANSTSDAVRITQAGSGNALLVEDSANPDSTPFVIDSSGRVLIGTSNVRTVGGSNGAILEIEGVNSENAASSIVRNSANPFGPIIALGKSRSASVDGVTAVSLNDALGNVTFSGADGTNMAQGASIVAQVDGTVASNTIPGRLVFNTTAAAGGLPTERLRIDSAGRILINTAERTNAASSSSLLQLESTGSSASAAFIRNSNDTSGSIIVVGKSRGTSTGSFTAVTSGDAIGQVSFQGTDGAALVGGAAIQGSVDGAVSSGIVPGRIAFSTRDSGGTLAERVRITSAGLVGINTSSPTSTNGGLDISSGGAGLVLGADLGAITRTNATVKYARTGGAHYTNAEEPVSLIMSESTSVANTVWIGGGSGIHNAATKIVFNTAANNTTLTGTERVAIDSVGRVLVGTASSNTIAGSAGQIQLAGTTGDTSTITQSRWNAGGNPAYFVMGASRGASVGTQGLVSNNDEVARIQFAASDGAAMQSVGYIAALVDGVAALNDTPGRLVFRTTPAGSVTPLERLRIDSSGNVGIGSTSLAGYALRIGKPITGAGTALGVAVEGTIQPDVTAGVYSFHSRPVAGSGVSLPVLYHYLANVSTHTGAITDQYGFASLDLSGSSGRTAAFYSTMSLGAAKYGLYLSGTADNYINGRVGIGTSSISYNLQVNETDTAAASANLLGLTTASGGVLQINVSDKSSATPTWNIQTGTSEPLAFWVGASERARIDSAGKVLVGTTSSNTIAGSAGQIQVAGTTGDTSTITQSRWNAGGNPAYFVMGASRGASIGTQGLVSNNDEVARIQFAASDGAAMQSIGYIAAVVDGVAALNDTPGRLVFRTTPAGSVTPLERLRIDSSGNVGIGTTSPLAKFQVTTGVAGEVARFGYSTGLNYISVGQNGANDAYTTRFGYNVGSEFGYIQAFGASGVGDDIAINPSGGNVGIGTTTPHTRLHSNGPIATAVTSNGATSYNIPSTDSTVLLTATTGTITATLPTAVGITGRQYTIKRTGTGATSYTVNTTSSQTIDGATTYTLSAQYATVTVQSDGANWVIISKF